MNPVSTSLLSLLFVFSGLMASLIMLNLTGNPRDRGKGSVRLRRLHRLLGYIFILLFAVNFVFMAKRLPVVATPLAAIHAALAFSLLPLLLFKVAIARWFKRLYPQLTALGLSVFVLAFVMVSVVAGIHLLPSKQSVPPISADVSGDMLDSTQAAEILENRCSRCHTLEKVEEAKKSLDEWRDTIDRMRGYVNDPQFLTESDAELLAVHLAQRESRESTQ